MATVGFLNGQLAVLQLREQTAGPKIADEQPAQELLENYPVWHLASNRSKPESLHYARYQLSFPPNEYRQRHRYDRSREHRPG